MSGEANRSRDDAIKKIVWFIHRSPKKGACHGRRATQERHRLDRENMAPLSWFPWEGMGEAG